MDDSTTASCERDRYERLLLVFELRLDLLFLATLSGVFSGVFEVFFFTVLVGTADARLGEKVKAKVIAALHNIRFTIQNLLGYGTILKGTKIRFFSSGPAMLDSFLS